MSVHFVLSETGQLYCDHAEVAVKHSSIDAVESLNKKSLFDDGRLYYRVPDELADLLMKGRVDAASKAKVNSNFDAIYGSAKTSETGGRSSGVYDIHGQENTCGEGIGPFFVGESGVEFIAPLSFGVGGDQIASTGISNSLIESATQGFAFDHRSDTLRDFISNNPLNDWVDAAKRIREAFDALEG